jgi:hypothetical protein
LFPGTRVQRLQASSGKRAIVWIGLAFIGLLLLALIATAFTSSDPTGTLLIGVAVIAMFGAAYGLMVWQTRRMLAELDRIADATGMAAGAVSGMIPGTAAYPVVAGRLAGGALEARSMKQSAGGPFTRVRVTDTGNAPALLAWLSQDSAAHKVSLLSGSVDGTNMYADISGVLGQTRVADAMIRLADRLKQGA